MTIVKVSGNSSKSGVKGAANRTENVKDRSGSAVPPGKRKRKARAQRKQRKLTRRRQG